MRIRKIIFLSAIFIFLKYSLFSEQTPQERPKVALVLGGGGAKGFAEIPVIELIERMDIPIDIVIGTSFGSIVGGMYCAGYSLPEIYETMAYTDWTPLFSDYEVSPFEAILKKHSIYNNMVNLTLGLDMSLKLGKGLSNGQNVYQLFKSFTLKYPSNMDFDNLIIPFRTVTTDMLTGEAVVLEKGDIAEAVRASMSIPGVFQPFSIDGHYYMDGGLRYNLPINIAKEMGYEIIIAIDVSQQVRDDPEVYDSNPAVAILNTITIAQATTTQAMYEDATIVIKPDMSTFSTFDFNKARDIYNEGERTARLVKTELEIIRQKIYPDDYDSCGNRKSPYLRVSNYGVYNRLPNLVPNELEIDGALFSDIDYIINSFAKIKNESLTVQNFLEFMNAIYLTGNYISIIPRFIHNGNRTLVELHLTSKEPKEAKILLNSVFEQTSSSSSSSIFDLSAEIQLRGITGIGSVLSIRATTITDLGATLFFFQPFNPYIFMEFESDYFQKRYATISKLQFYNSNYTTFSAWKNSCLFGVRTNNGNLIKIGPFLNINSTPWRTLLFDPFFDNYAKTNFPDLPLSHNDKLSSQCFGLFGNYTLDTRDRKLFPHRGIYTNFAVKLLLPFNSHEINSLSIISTLNFNSTIPINKHVSLTVSLMGGTDWTRKLLNNVSLIPSEGFSNFDRFYFPQMPNQTQHGINKVSAAFIFQAEPLKKLTILGGDLFFRFGATAGNVTYDWSKIIPLNEQDNKDYPILWSTFAGAALRLRESFGVNLRVGIGSTTEKKATPFFTIDIGSFEN